MESSVFRQFGGEQEVGVPRRFSIGAAFVLVTTYSVLFRLLVLLGAPTAWTFLICAFAGVVTFAQMALFRGQKPRAASMLAGFVTAPLLFGLVMLDEVSTRLLGMRPIAYGFHTYGSIAPALLLSLVVGLVGGYVIGLGLAGVFYVLQKIRPSSVSASLVTKEEEPSRSLALLEKFETLAGAVWRILNPAPKGTPFHRAITVFELSLLLAFLSSPFLISLPPSQVWIACGFVGLVLAFWMGNLELLFVWPIALVCIGYFLSGQIIGEMGKVPSFDYLNNAPRVRDSVNFFVGFMCVAGCLAAGMSVSATFGWLQWIVLRNSKKVRFGPIAFVVACALMIGLGVVATFGIRAVARTPKQQLIAKIREAGGHCLVDLNQEFVDVRLSGDVTDADAILAISNAQTGGFLELNSPNLTAKSLSALNDKSLNWFIVGDVEIADSDFDSVSGFSARFLYFQNRRVSSRLLSGMLKDPLMTSMVEQASFRDIEFADYDFSVLSGCKALKSLQFVRCDLATKDLSTLGQAKSLESLTLHSCRLTDDDLAELLAVLPPKVERLEVASNELTDQALVMLATLRGLKQVNVEDNHRITAEGIATFEKARPNCVVRWTRTDDQSK